MSFWASKLNGEQPKPTVAIARDMFTMYNPTPQPVAQQPSIPQAPQYQPTVQMSAGGICPSCHSTNYVGRHTTGALMACPECGYNEKFQQFGHGLKSLDSKGAAQPARQTNDSQTIGMAMAQLNGAPVQGDAPQTRQAYSQYN